MNSLSPNVSSSSPTIQVPRGAPLTARGSFGRLFGGAAYWLSAAAVLSLGAAGCGGSTPPAEDPPVLLDKPSEEEQAPSTEAVKAGRDAIQAADFAQAEAILAKASADYPEDPQAAFYYGVALEGVNKLPEAEAQYRRAISLSDQLLEARANLSYLLVIKLDKPEAAVEVADQGLKLDPKNPALLANRAAALDVLGSPDAVSAYESLLAVVPDDANNRFNYAVLLASQERPADAAAALDQLKTKDVALLLDVADLYGRLDGFEQCIARLDEGAAIAKSAKLLVYRARCKLAKKDTTGAEADLREAVTVEPDASIGHFYLGKQLMAGGKKAEGKKHLEIAAKAGAEDPFAQAATRALAGGK